MAKRKRRRNRNAEPKQNTEVAPTPAQRYRAAMDRNAYAKTQRAAFASQLDFELDPFQAGALESIEAGRSVLVAAPTGAGKTIVGEFALYLALKEGRRAFYTTPIKALSNQKYRELVARYGDGQVGLLTGDTSINGDANLVVMTTEVARNMIYQGRDLSDLAFIVLDEVHYLADRFRGPVWEEVLIQTPAHVNMVALSATVSNAEEFGQWIEQVRGDCDIIVSETRPVPLYQHMMVGRKIYDLYSPVEKLRTPHGKNAGKWGENAGSSSKHGDHAPARVQKPLSKRKLNPDLRAAVARATGIQSRSVGERRRGLAGGRRIRTPKRVRRPSRAEVAISLEHAHLLPAIYFIFSRAGCDDAVDHLVTAGITLTNRTEREQIRAIVEEATATLPAADMAVVGVDRWIMGLEAGVAAHHAGLLPIMKQTVETLFSRGLIKIVFATETLALGINMPARTVVLEALRKWNGMAHVPLSPGEYTQLTGRAGRRGIDTEGHSVVVYTSENEPELVASLASKRTYPLVSAFRPTYNMVANLTATGSMAQAREVMDRSFAQFQADRKVVAIAHDSKAAENLMQQADHGLECSHGNVKEYLVARDELTRLQKEGAKARARFQSVHPLEVLDLQVGEVVSFPVGKRMLDAVVTRRARRGGRNPMVQIVTQDGHLRTAIAQDFTAGLTVLGHMRLRKDVLRSVRRCSHRIGRDLTNMRKAGKLMYPKRARPPMPKHNAKQIDQLEHAVRTHPVHHCPHRDQHARTGREWLHARREYLRLSRKVDQQTSSITKKFDAIVRVLQEEDCLDGERLTAAGQILRGIYSDRDLVVSLCLHEGVWEGLTPAQLAAVASTCVFEPRKNHDPDMDIPGGPKGRLSKALTATQRIMTRVNKAESQAHAPTTMPLEYGLVNAMYWWVNGDPLATAVQAADLEPGDWVRWCRQVIDLLGQVKSQSSSELARTCDVCVDSIRRSVVALAEEA